MSCHVISCHVRSCDVTCLMLGATHHTIAASLSSPLLFRNFRVSCAVRSCTRATCLHATAWRPRAPPGRCPGCRSTCPPSPPCPPRARRRPCPGTADTPPSPAPPPRRSEPAPSKYFPVFTKYFGHLCAGHPGDGGALAGAGGADTDHAAAALLLAPAISGDTSR